MAAAAQKGIKYGLLPVAKIEADVWREAGSDRVVLEMVT